MSTHISLTTLDFVVIIAYVVALLGLGFWVSFRRSHSNDLFLADRSLGWFYIGCSIFGSNVGPGMLISSCGVAYATGMAASNFEWLAWIFMLILAMVFIPQYLHTKISTMPEFLSYRFSNSCRNFLSWYVAFSTLVMWTGGTLYVGAVLLSQIVAWPLWVSVVFLAFISTSFTITGGLAAVAVTDSFQTLVIIAGSATLTILGLIKVGGFGSLANSVPPDYWHLFRPASDTTYPWPAILLGYPVMGIWFWCTEQTIVQRVLGGRDLCQGQLGIVFAGFLKIIIPFIFFLPGIICKVLHPNLANSDQAYITMVANHLPIGLTGLVVAVLIASLVSTVDAGLNSFSTICTLDIYTKLFRPSATRKELRLIGQILTFTAGVVSIGIAISFSKMKMDLFNMGMSVLSFLAPSMSAVFLIGVVWKRATATAALTTLIAGSISSIIIGILFLTGWPSRQFWPHYMLLSFYLFVGIVFFMIGISLVSKNTPTEKPLISFKRYSDSEHSSKLVWSLWGILAVLMVMLYVIFN